MSDLVSVVIPAYNAAWCIRRAIDSALVQSWTHREIIVVDDGSTDGTSRILDSYGARIRVVRKANGGLSSARNAGIAAAQGEFVAFLDADDWWLPGKLRRQLEEMAAHSDAHFCSTAAKVVSGEGAHLGVWRCPPYPGTALEAIFAANGYVAGSGSAVLARRAPLIAVGAFDESLRSLEDVDLWMRLAAHGGYRYIDEPLAVIVKHANSMSRQFDAMRAAAMVVMRKNRSLLPYDKRGAFWRQAYAGMLSDYAKWAYRAGRRGQAFADLLTGMRLAPFSRGRMILGLLTAMLTNQPM